MTSPLARLAMSAYRGGRFDEAANHCGAILKAAPRDLGALRMLGAIAQAAGRMEEALALAERAALVAPNDPDVLAMCGALRLHLGNAEGALGPLGRALDRQPGNPALLNSRASALQALGRYAEALACYDKALKAGPAHAEALLQRGRVLMALGRPAEALASFERAREAGAADPAQVEFARGNALLALNRALEAKDCFLAVVAAQPANETAWNNLAIAWQRLGRDDDALKIYDRLLARADESSPTYFGRAQLHLAHGRFSAGWRDHLARHSIRDQRDLLFQDRLPADLSGETLWLRKDQGIGDELFFLRFAAQLRSRGPRLIYQAGDKIAPLIRRARIVDEIIGEDALIPEDARVISIGDLPYTLGHADGDAVPASVALAPLAEPSEKIIGQLAAMGKPPYIGVTWRAGTIEHGGLYKEVPIDALARTLSRLPGTLLSLQRLPQPGEVENVARLVGRPVHDFAKANDNLEEMLALIARLNEYICVSNTNTHLRASLGLPSRVLVPMPADWRWMASGGESPWFPGTGLYRQAAEGSWDSALARLATDLVAELPAH